MVRVSGVSHRRATARGMLFALVFAVCLAALALSGVAAPSPLAGGSEASTGAHLHDAGALARLGDRALRLASEQTPDPVLRQVDTDRGGGRVFFRFTDASATFEIDVLVPSPSAPPGQWQVTRPPVSKLVGHVRPGMELLTLRVSPADALRLMTAHWSGCAPRGLTLAGERDALTWYAFCNLPDGRVASGTVDGRTGAFAASPAPPALPPPTATPAP